MTTEGKVDIAVGVTFAVFWILSLVMQGGLERMKKEKAAKDKMDAERGSVSDTSGSSKI